MMSIRQLREERAWSQRDLAIRLGVSPQSVFKWEHGLAVPNETNRYRLMLLFTSTSSNAPQAVQQSSAGEQHGGEDTAAGLPHP